MARFSEVLKNKNFFLLWIGQIISQFGERLNQMALIGLVYKLAPGSTLQLAKLFSFTIIPVFLIGPIAGVYVDRWDRRRTMFICDIIRSALVLSIAAFLLRDTSLMPIYLMIFLIFCVGRFYILAKLSIVPDLVKEKELLLANSLVQTTGMIAVILGLGLGGVLVEFLGARGGFILGALSFVTSAAIIFFISKAKLHLGNPKEILKVGKEVLEVIQKSVIAEIKDGFVYLLRQKDIRSLINISFMLWSALGAVYVVIIIFVQESLKTVTLQLGILAMLLGAGLFSGSMLYGRLGQKISPFKMIFFCLGLSGLTLACFTIVLSQVTVFFWAALIAFILGLVVSPIIIAAPTLIHRISENQMRGKVFSSLEVVMHLAFIIFMFVSSILAEHIGAKYILISVAFIMAIVGFVCFVRLGRLDISNGKIKRI